VLGAEAEQLHCVVDRREARLGRDPLGPLLNDAALDLDAPAALAARQVVMVPGGVALPVQSLARRVADRVDRALLAEHLKVPVHGGEADGLTLAAQLSVDLLGAAEAGEAGERGRHGRRLPGAPHPGAARLIHCHTSHGSRPFWGWPRTRPMAWDMAWGTAWGTDWDMWHGTPGSAFWLFTDNRNDYH
jgi:hypothetical protein